MRAWIGLAATAALLAACGQNAGGDSAGGAGAPRQQVWAAGSSTVFPFATRVAEQVARVGGGAPAKVESLGTGGGIKLFCGGVGPAFPDIANASRPMKKSEFEACQKNGATDIAEIKIGYDGIVIANALDGAAYDLTEEEIFRALAAELPSGGAFVKNTAVKWSDVEKSLPADRILAYGPPPTSGTRDAFVELAMEGGAKKIPELAKLKESDADGFKARAHAIRGDGAWVDAGENDNAIVQTLTKTPGSLGVFGFSFLENNADKVKGASINGVKPTPATISDGSYPLSRSLYIYVKKANIGVTPGLKEFVQEFVSDAANGQEGYLRERGLIPLPADVHAAMKKAAQELPSMTAPAS